MDAKLLLFLVMFGFFLLAIGLACFAFAPQESPAEEMEGLKEEFRRVRERYATAARWYGTASPEARFLETECHRLEDLESELNETESTVRAFKSFGTILLLAGIMLLSFGFFKVLR